MTTKQLYEDIRAMGFDRRDAECDTDRERVFVSAVNRATESLSALFPLYDELTIDADGVSPCLKVARKTLDAHKRLLHTEENVRSFSLTLRGVGEALITQNKVPFARYTVNSAHTSRTFVGQFPQNAVFGITLTAGESALEMRDFALYTEAGAPRRREADFYVYPLCALTEGALSIDTPPRDSRGHLLTEGRDYRTQNGFLYLSDKIKGQLSLTIRRAPHRFEMGCEAPDVQEACAHLLPLLTASYVWLDEDSEKSLFYLAMYREALARTLGNGRCAGVGGSYCSSNGW